MAVEQDRRGSRSRRSPKGGEDMPAFGKKLTKEQIESLVKDDVRGFGRKK